MIMDRELCLSKGLRIGQFCASFLASSQSCVTVWQRLLMQWSHAAFRKGFLAAPVCLGHAVHVPALAISSTQLSVESPWPVPPISHPKEACGHWYLLHTHHSVSLQKLRDSREMMVQETLEQTASCVHEDLHEKELRVFGQVKLKWKALKISMMKQARHGSIGL